MSWRLRVNAFSQLIIGSVAKSCPRPITNAFDARLLSTPKIYSSPPALAKYAASPAPEFITAKNAPVPLVE
jgi:hypothetical protein